MERKKTTAFLLGLIVAMSLLFGALEYSSRSSYEDVSDDMLEQFDEDMELLPVLDKEELAAVEEPPESAPSIEEKLTEVSQTVSPSDIDKQELEIQGGMGNSAQGKTPEKVERKTPALPPVPLDEDENPLNWRVVEDLPEFPGGMVEFMKWLTKNLKYPSSARSRKIEGKVVVQFVVNKDGSVSDLKLLKSVEPSLDREALRVVGMLPKWTPGKHNGATCRTLFVIPIVFKL